MAPTTINLGTPPDHEEPATTSGAAATPPASNYNPPGTMIPNSPGSVLPSK